jgi:hypothetical protein
MTDPTPGNCLIKTMSIGNIFPKRFNNPKISSAIPNIGQPTMTRNTPKPRHPVARAFRGCRKYPAVRPGPMVNGTPAINNKFPNRIKDLLKNKLIPNMVNTTPPAKKTIPTFLFPKFKSSGILGKDGDD